MSFDRRQILSLTPAALAAGAGTAMLASGAQASTSAISAAAMGVRPGRRGDQSRALQTVIDTAAKTGAPVVLPSGRVRAGNVRLHSGVQLIGLPGRSVLESTGNRPILRLDNSRQVRLSGLTLDGAFRPLKTSGDDVRGGLVQARSCRDLRIEHCLLINSGGNGLTLEETGGAISGVTVQKADKTGIFSLDAAGLEISHNVVRDCGNNGIQVWRGTQGEDGTLVSHNRVFNIAATDGGSGENGNGVNIFRAGAVMIDHNRIQDCAFTAVRVNAGNDCQITGNSCSRLGEVAIFVEFGFEGAVVSGNVINGAATGISVTNFDKGGRLAVVSGNLVRNLSYRRDPADIEAGGTGIWVEADAAVSGNTVEGAPRMGLLLGWGPYLRHIAATGNVLRQCGIGIGVSSVEKPGQVLITGNMIAGAAHGAIRGMAWTKPSTPDLLKKGTPVPAHILLQGNLVA
ncbi:MAG TPA: TIGR03808 family TAT-translocated repetitive protein [Rhodobacteraceae bacterium]|nr:TIGR03808 family TAT-translocated repetitive protein [Paracoccaceae bacterium]